MAKGDLAHWTDHDAIVPDISEPIRGDVAVSAAGQLLPYLKWADDFDRSAKKDGTKYPVKFVDYCSQVQNRNTPFDDFHGDTYETSVDWSMGTRVESFLKFTRKSGMAKNSEKGSRIAKNEYIGLYCKCSDDSIRKDFTKKVPTGHSCDHGNFAEDDLFLYFYSNSLLGHQKSDAIGQDYFKSEEEAREFVDECRLRFG